MTIESLKHMQIDKEPTVENVEHCHKMAEEPQQKPEGQWDRYKDRFMDVFPELVDGVTKCGLDSSEIGDAIQRIKLVSEIHIILHV